AAGQAGALADLDVVAVGIADEGVAHRLAEHAHRAARAAAAGENPLVLGNAIEHLDRGVAISRSAPLRAARLDLALLGDDDQGIAAAIAAPVHPLVLHGFGPEAVMRGAIVDPQQDRDSLDAVMAPGHESHA